MSTSSSGSSPQKPAREDRAGHIRAHIGGDAARQVGLRARRKRKSQLRRIHAFPKQAVRRKRRGREGGRLPSSQQIKHGRVAGERRAQDLPRGNPRFFAELSGKIADAAEHRPSELRPPPR